VLIYGCGSVNLALAQTDNRKATANRKRTSRDDPVDTLVVLIPCLQFVQFKIVGVLSGSDLVLLGTFIALVLREKVRISTPDGKRFLVLGSLWLASQCVTDIVRHTAFTDYARGWSNIGMTLVNFAVIWTLLYGRPRRLELYGWGLVIGTLLTIAFNPGEFTLDSPWKFGFSYPVTLGVFLLTSREKSHSRAPIIVVAMIGIVNIALGSRNTGGVCLAAAMYLLVADFLRRKARAGSKLKAGVVVALAASILVGATGILWAYQYGASAGILGEQAKEKYEEESSGKYGVLLGGRTELLASIPAVYDSPILGHGSWARDRIYYIGEVRALALLGYKGAVDVSKEELIEGFIPAHSYLLQAWVYGGIVGALFWVWVYAFVARALMRVYPDNVALLPVAGFVAFSLLWDILFSPFGATTRIVVPYYIVMLASCMSMVRQTAAQVVTSAPKKRKALMKRRVHAAFAPRPQQ
jgi:hypothetical protein